MEWKLLFKCITRKREMCDPEELGKKMETAQQ